MNENFLGGRVVVKFGDITHEETDAIVNAANSTLMGGGGVDGAIHEAAGESLLYECKKIRQTDYPNGLPTSEAVITSGGELTAKYVIHTVGPIYGSNKGKDAQMLSDSYFNCLKLAAENHIKTISFPSISTGAFAYPKEEAAQVSSQVIEDFLDHDATIAQVFLVFYSQNDARNFSRKPEIQPRLNDLFHGGAFTRKIQNLPRPTRWFIVFQTSKLCFVIKQSKV